MALKRLLLGLLIVVVAAALALPSTAQEATETPMPLAEETPESTPEAEATGIVAPLEAAAVITETIPFEESILERLQLPEGFEINVFAQNLGNARWMAVMPDGFILLTRRMEGDVVALADQNGDGRSDSDEINVVASDLPYVHGITFNNGNVYLATDTKALVAPYAGSGNLGALSEIISDLPTGGQHPNRTLAFGPDGMLYITIGSTCNACDETDPESATIVRAQPDGSAREVFAVGLRNTIGFGWHPVSGEMWGMDHGSDWRGDDQPPEELNRLEFEGNYGWPWCFADQQVDLYIAVPPPGGGGREPYCEKTLAPALTYTAHSAPIGMIFYTADQFPAEYRNDAFVAMRGSWNRSEPSGYEIVRVHFGDDGQPTEFETFLSGFLIREQLANFGRVAGLVVAPDGSLLLAEDTNGIIYRVSYTGQ